MLKLGCTKNKDNTKGYAKGRVGLASEMRRTILDWEKRPTVASDTVKFHRSKKDMYFFFQVVPSFRRC
jgi:hypothetical protein